jgi:hypothetical protein
VEQARLVHRRDDVGRKLARALGALGRRLDHRRKVLRARDPVDGLVVFGQHR